MTLEDKILLKNKNQKRLRDLFVVSFSLGIHLKTPSSRKDLLKLVTITLVLASCGCVYGNICYILRYKHNILITAESICTMLQTLLSIFKLIYILLVQRQFYNMIKLISTHKLVDQIEFLAMETPYNRILRIEVRKILDSCWSNAMGQFAFYKYACISIISYYFLNSQGRNAYNWYIGNTNHTIILPYPTLYPFWENKMNKLPQYFILTFLVLSGNFIAGVGAICFDGMFIILAMHCVALIRVLRRIIEFSTSSIVPRELHLNYLHQCINHYERTFRFYKELNDLYLHISLMQFLLSLIIHGVVMFQLSISVGNDFMTVIRMIMFMAASFYEVVIYCLNGQFLSSESEYLPNTWFHCKWYKESKEFQHLIMMMIIRSNRTFRMNASWFSTLSLPTLIELVKTSGSYFLLLRNLSA